MHIIGIGIDGRKGLSSSSTETILSADLIFGGKRLLELFPDAQGEKHPIVADLQWIVEIVRTRPGKRVVVLGSGDPNFFGISDFILRNFPKDDVEIVPAVSSMQWAFAKARIPWSHAAVISLHGRGGARPRNLDALFEALQSTDTVGIFTDQTHTPAVIARALLDHRMNDCRVIVCEDLGEPTERVAEGCPEELVDRAFSAMNVVIVQKAGRPQVATPIPLGLPDAAYARRGGMITKAEVRAVSLAKLGLTHDCVLWDIGAGSGSLSVEAAWLAPHGHVYAVEKDPQAWDFILHNAVAFGRMNLELVKGEAPHVLEGLPTPNRVFIGGSGGNLHAILEAVDRSLRPAGRVVVNSVLLETMTEASSFFKEHGYRVEVCTINVSRTEDVAGKQMFKAENPVFIITASKP